MLVTNTKILFKFSSNIHDYYLKNRKDDKYNICMNTLLVKYAMSLCEQTQPCPYTHDVDESCRPLFS